MVRFCVMEGHEITKLLDRWGCGDDAALGELMPLVYTELKQIAAAYMKGERPSATLQVTALVHEAYLRLSECDVMKFENRKHFYVFAAQAIRRVLVDYARRRGALKRNPVLAPASAMEFSPDVDILDLDEALSGLAQVDPEKARVVELRYFAGLSVPEVAEMTGTSRATVKRHWAVARAWLYRRMTGTEM